MPMMVLSPTTAPWTTAPWPTDTQSPSTVACFSEWSTQQSCTLHPRPRVMAMPSPRSTALNHTEQSGPRVTSPTTAAPGRMTASPSL